MKRILVSASLFCMASVSWAIDKNDPMTSIASGSTFIAAKDLTILANTSETRLLMASIDGAWLSCYLYTDSATSERLLKAGSILRVNHAEEIDDGLFYKDGSSAVVFFDNATIKTLKCFAGEPLGDNYKVPSVGRMEQGLAEKFVFSQSPAEQIPVENICK